MGNKSLIISIIIVVVLAAVGFYFLRYSKSPMSNTKTPIGDYSGITSFRDCADAGFSVTQSLPHQCRTPDGRILVEGVNNPTAPLVKDGCYVGGCGSQLCTDQPATVSSCVFKDEFACYKTAICARQTNGACGWTQTPELEACVWASNQVK
jgi:hypothetical protein